MATQVQALPNNVYTTRPPTTLNARPTTVHFNRLNTYATRPRTPIPHPPAPPAESLGVADEVEVPAHGGLAYRTDNH